MSKPSRPSELHHGTYHPRTFFLTTKTAGGRRLFRTDRMALLFIAVLRDKMREGKFNVHNFVVMPDHVHILLTVPGDLTVERAMQLIKGGFSFRAKSELGFQGEVWQRGFSDVRISDDRSFQEHQAYIAHNPIKAHLASAPEDYPYGSVFLKMQKHAGTKVPARVDVVRHD